MRPRAAVTAMAIASRRHRRVRPRAGPGTSNVTLTVTRNFGAAPVAQLVERRIPGVRDRDAAARAPRCSVTTRYGGGFVESIDGLSGTSARRDWFYYVNGVEAPQGAATTAVHQGDRIWWDLHDWSATDFVPGGRRLVPRAVPARHRRQAPARPRSSARPTPTAACKRVSRRAQHRSGSRSPAQLIGTGSGTDSLGVVVGTWRDLRGGDRSRA